MKEYQVKSNKSLLFEVTGDDKLIGTLIYQSWYKFNAEMQIANSGSYLLEPKGFWGTSVELKDGQTVLLKFSMSWNGEIVIETCFNNDEKGFIFKHKGFFKESFILMDQEGVELLVMKPNIQWSKMNYEYQITTSDAFESVPRKEVLIMTLVHCANYYMSFMAGTM